jgi:hypothetical protein
MTYTAFTASKPDPAADNGTQAFDYTRKNLLAIRDAAIMGGGFYGWPLAISGGTAEQPTTFTYSSGTERVKAVITWGSTGGATGNPQTVVYSYSSNSGGAYDTIGTKTVTYDSNGNVTATSWA